MQRALQNLSTLASLPVLYYLRFWGHHPIQSLGTVGCSVFDHFVKVTQYRHITKAVAQGRCEMLCKQRPKSAFPQGSKFPLVFPETAKHIFQERSHSRFHFYFSSSKLNYKLLEDRNNVIFVVHPTVTRKMLDTEAVVKLKHT